MQEKTLSERLHLDIPIIFGLFVLCCVGLVVLYSAGNQSTDVIVRQAIRMSIAFGVMFVFAQIPTYTLQRWSFGIYLIGVILLICVLFFGDMGKGAQRWLDLGFVRFQPSEIMKLAVPMVVAWLLAETSLPPKTGNIFWTLFLIVVPVVMIAKQPDLGTSLLVATAGLSVLFVSGLSWRWVIGFLSLASASLPILWYAMHDYQKRRVLTFLNPEEDPLGSGYHIIQSKIAIGSGGINGKGWLNGTQSHLEFLPERSTDFIFAVFCEEFGFIGVVLLVLLYLFIILRGLYISVYAQENYGRLLGAGITLTFFVYLIVNIGMVSGQLPVVGIPLPLVSLGGTSMVTLMMGFGILMGIHTNRRLLSR